MLTILVFALALFLAALISELADRSIVSTTVLFLVIGFLAGPGMLGLIDLGPRAQVMSSLAEFAMYAVLFTGGMELTKTDLVRGWRLPTLALAVGLPLSVILTALLARYTVGADWLSALLVGAVLAPTDPVFASAIVGRREIPVRLRNLLNIESGLNDGLALPLVVALLGIANGVGANPGRLALNLVLGAAIGIGIPRLCHWIEQRKLFTVSEQYEPLFGLSIGLLVYAIGSLTRANLFVAAFTAGVSVATLQPRFRDTFCEFGEIVSELLKLGTVMLFGALLSPEILRAVPLRGYVFAVLTLLVVRPLSLEIALHRAPLPPAERVAAYWFGPKGFASIVYGMFVLRSGVPDGDALFRLIAIVVGLSIVAHSSTDVMIARWFAPPGRTDEAPHADSASAAGR
jgi:sodium/hydrogen antiporter